MEFRDLILAQHARAHAASTCGAEVSNQDNVLRDVTPEQMRHRPGGEMNSLAWLLWHISRAEDIGMNVIIAEQAQVFDDDGWAERLNFPRRDFGPGMTSVEVDELNERIDLDALLEYRAAVGQQTHAILSDISTDQLDRLIEGELLQRATDAGAFGPHAGWVSARWDGKPKAFILTHTVLAHSFVHLGQADIVRGSWGCQPSDISMKRNDGCA